MSQIIVRSPTSRSNGTTDSISSAIRFRGADHPVNFSASPGPCSAGADPFLPLGLVTAMRTSRTLRLEAPVSAALHQGLDRIQTELLRGDPTLSRVLVSAPVRGPEAEARDRGNGAFFSGGVDSFYNLINRSEQISHLIFVGGFDIPLEDQLRHRIALDLAKQVAMHFGKDLIHVTTDLRSFTNGRARWAQHAHGPAMVGVAYLLRKQLRRVLIAGEYLGATALAPASRVELDPLWTTDEMEIQHVDHLVNRVAKLRRIANLPVVQRCLRVCWEQRNSAINCCECSKCLRNMAILHALGVLPRFSTFPKPLDLSRLSTLRLPVDRTCQYEAMSEALAIAGRDPGKRAFCSALSACLRTNSRLVIEE